MTYKGRAKPDPVHEHDCERCDALLDLALDCWMQFAYFSAGGGRDCGGMVTLGQLRSTLLEAGRIGQDGMPMEKK